MLWLGNKATKKKHPSGIILKKQTELIMPDLQVTCERALALETKFRESFKPHDAVTMQEKMKKRQSSNDKRKTVKRKASRAETVAQEGHVKRKKSAAQPTVKGMFRQQRKVHVHEVHAFSCRPVCIRPADF